MNSRIQRLWHWIFSVFYLLDVDLVDVLFNTCSGKCGKRRYVVRALWHQLRRQSQLIWRVADLTHGSVVNILYTAVTR